MLWTRPGSVKEERGVPQFEFCAAETANQTQISEAETKLDLPRAWPEQPPFAKADIGK